MCPLAIAWTMDILPSSTVSMIFFRVSYNEFVNLYFFPFSAGGQDIVGNLETISATQIVSLLLNI